MSVVLRPLREDEFAAWAAHHRAWYADDLHAHGGMTVEAARAKAAADEAALFPDGFATPANVLLVIEEHGRRVGSVWFAARDERGEQVAFLYAIEVDEEERGRGLGRQAMLLFEQEARSRGFAEARLNVFGGNAAARGLYGSLGWAELAVWMGKSL